jgi:hypothetical protein
MPQIIETITYRVLREFPGPGGKKFLPGEVVDCSEWRDRNVVNLVEGRYITPIYDEDDVPHHLYKALIQRIDELEGRLVAVEGQLIAKKPGPKAKNIEG